MIRLVSDFPDWLNRRGAPDPFQTAAYFTAIRTYSARLLGPTERVRLAQALLVDLCDAVEPHSVCAVPLDHNQEELEQVIERLADLRHTRAKAPTTSTD